MVGKTAGERAQAVSLRLGFVFMELTAALTPMNLIRWRTASVFRRK
jgi:hypothetical protein